MIPICVQQLSALLDGELYHIPNPGRLIERISIDSRHIEAGCAFFAIKGEQFDGHDFIDQSINNGAAIAIVARQSAMPYPQLVVHKVEDALGKLASWVRQNVSTKLVALTGSSGKTSVKEMTASILKQCGQTHYTQGNQNNAIGVPLTLLELTSADRYAVIELGANHKHEIAYATQLTAPTSVLVTNIAAAHLEGFGSLAGVAAAKGEIFLGLPQQGGNALLNYDSYSPNWLKGLANHSISFFSLDSKKADYYASDVLVAATKTTFLLHTPTGNFPVILPLIGLHNVTNAIAAAALALSIGAAKDAVQAGLSALKPVKGRLYPIALNENQRIYDDTYNANVGSMQAAIAVLASQPGYRVLVVGDMGELGKKTVHYHKQIGTDAKNANIDCVLSFGKLSEIITKQHANGRHFTDKASLIAQLNSLILAHPTLTILVKGSRSMAMEEIVEQVVKFREK